MENYAYSSYPDSGNSSPRSHEIEYDNDSNHHPASWVASNDDPPAAAASTAVVGRVKLMISYGGRIQPQPHDNKLSYHNGETKILSINRSMRFPDFHSKLSAITGSDEVCIAYQLSGEDLNALISVTNDEDLNALISISTVRPTLPDQPLTLGFSSFRSTLRLLLQHSSSRNRSATGLLMLSIPFHHCPL